ncbi:MAG TPA: hypothetical protein PJ994_11120, partial [Tepidiformaceae bacterium]|nr:hypothetical protein [Tepidiformaceae bacterium]
MHIGEFHESASRDVTARREAAVTELRQLADRLSAAPGNAIPPAAPLPDSVRISPEARAAMNSLIAGPPATSASPADVIAAL